MQKIKLSTHLAGASTSTQKTTNILQAKNEKNQILTGLG